MKLAQREEKRKTWGLPCPGGRPILENGPSGPSHNKTVFPQNPAPSEDTALNFSHQFKRLLKMTLTWSLKKKVYSPEVWLKSRSILGAVVWILTDMHSFSRVGSTGIPGDNSDYGHCFHILCCFCPKHLDETHTTFDSWTLSSTVGIPMKCC